ncbi:hypothetical protein [Oscillatoria sp. FACHB-1407]|uniref:hypothetical protein n=1 Tax=Oscillatoria sp. FACHB-1407 TaxID=2692847 RepID=UPI001F555115|nr:hypothetical protein [Oscillatoria sp. FACHB-1407]
MDSSAATPDETSDLTVDTSDTTALNDSSDSDAIMRQQPIPPASEPMQYRAIGLIRGKYTASEEQFTRGTLTTEDGVPIDAVLLGRVMSLVKKHLDLEQSHLWVVYPRTRNKDNDLHAQIVGVWEPEKLNKAIASPEETTSESTSPEAPSESPSEPEESAANPQEDYFSIRGEVLFYSLEEERLIVKIQQSPRKGDEEGKSFKLNLKGTLEGKVVGYFWDLNVQRQDNLLVVQDGTMIALVPPKKRGKTKKPFRGGRPGGGGGRKRWDGPPRDGQRPSGDRRGGDRPGDRSNVGAPPARREALPKPIKKKSQPNPD